MGKIYLNTLVSGLEHRDGKITGISNSSKLIPVLKDDVVINTLPITVTSKLLGKTSSLEFRGIASVYISCHTNKALIQILPLVIFSDPSISFNRITEPTKLAPHLNIGNQNRSPYC